MKSLGNIVALLKSENFYSFSGNIIVAIFGLLNFSLMARGFASKTAFGEWILFLTANSIVEMIRIGLCRSGFIKYFNSCGEHRRKYLIGSTYQILIGSSLIFFVLLLILRLFFYSFLESTSFAVFFEWYLFLTIVNIPFIHAQILLQAKLKFKAILILRFISLGLFTIYLTGTYYLKGVYDLTEVIIVYIIIAAITSIISIVLKYDGIKYFFHARKGERGVLLRFGFYNVGTQLGASLLKTSDAFCMGLFACLGPTAVAIYGVAYKMIEIIELPVRSFSATAFPKMSAAVGQNKTTFSKLLYQHVGFLTLLLFPILIGAYFMAGEIVFLLGGEGYEEAIPVFKIFILFGLFIPFDRLTGVALDSLNMPKINFYKVLIMLIVNVGGNILVILIACKLWPVAVVTIITVIAGAFIGYYSLLKVVKLNLLMFFVEGKNFIVEFIKSKGSLKFG